MTIEGRFRLERRDFVLDVGLHIPGKGVTVIFGPSGSGKTTLLLSSPDWSVVAMAFCGSARRFGRTVIISWADHA